MHGNLNRSSREVLASICSKFLANTIEFTAGLRLAKVESRAFIFILERNLIYGIFKDAHSLKCQIIILCLLFQRFVLIKKESSFKWFRGGKKKKKSSFWTTPFSSHSLWKDFVYRKQCLTFPRPWYILSWRDNWTLSSCMFMVVWIALNISSTSSRDSLSSFRELATLPLSSSESLTFLGQEVNGRGLAGTLLRLSDFCSTGRKLYLKRGELF